MGVHYSRIQSLDLDVLGTSELLVSHLQQQFRKITGEQISPGGSACEGYSPVQKS